MSKSLFKWRWPKRTGEASIDSAACPLAVMIAKTQVPALLLASDGKILTLSAGGAILARLWQNMQAPIQEICAQTLAANRIEALRLGGEVTADHISNLNAGPLVEGRYSALLMPAFLAPNSLTLKRAPFSSAEQEGLLSSPEARKALMPKIFFGGKKTAAHERLLLLGFDTTLPDQVTKALIESRLMLKTLLDQSVTMAFECDEQGLLRFITPVEIFGQQARDWQGRSGAAFFWPNSTPFKNPFLVRAKEHFMALSANGPDGVERFFDFDVEPIWGSEGQWRGVRGSCREVSEQVKANRAARLLGLRLSVLGQITRLLNGAESADDLLDRAATIMRDILRAEAVWIFFDDGEKLVPKALEGQLPADFDGMTLHNDLYRDGEQGDDGPVAAAMLMVRLSASDSEKGLMLVSRDTILNPWSSDERDLFAAVGDSLNAAFAKALLFDKLHRYSSRDELTGLWNRRALRDTIERRLKHQERTGQRGTLLFIDLDHFKEVNDQLGHKAGDNALKGVAALMESLIRPSDYAGRLGGDEFVIWLEAAREEDAVRKGEAIIEGMKAIKKEIGAAHLRLSASIGVAVSVPGLDYSFEALAERADAALYAVKAAGRGQVAVAALPAAPLADDPLAGASSREIK